METTKKPKRRSLFGGFGGGKKEQHRGSALLDEDGDFDDDVDLHASVPGMHYNYAPSSQQQNHHLTTDAQSGALQFEPPSPRGRKSSRQSERDKNKDRSRSRSISVTRAFKKLLPGGNKKKSREKSADDKKQKYKDKKKAKEAASALDANEYHRMRFSQESYPDPQQQFSHSFAGGEFALQDDDHDFRSPRKISSVQRESPPRRRRVYQEDDEEDRGTLSDGPLLSKTNRKRRERKPRKERKQAGEEDDRVLSPFDRSYASSVMDDSAAASMASPRTKKTKKARVKRNSLDDSLDDFLQGGSSARSDRRTLAAESLDGSAMMSPTRRSKGKKKKTRRMDDSVTSFDGNMSLRSEVTSDSRDIGSPKTPRAKVKKKKRSSMPIEDFEEADRRFDSRIDDTYSERQDRGDFNFKEASTSPSRFDKPRTLSRRVEDEEDYDDPFPQKGSKTTEGPDEEPQTPKDDPYTTTKDSSMGFALLDETRREAFAGLDRKEQASERSVQKMTVKTTPTLDEIRSLVSEASRRKSTDEADDHSADLKPSSRSDLSGGSDNVWRNSVQSLGGTETWEANAPASWKVNKKELGDFESFTSSWNEQAKVGKRSSSRVADDQEVLVAAGQAVESTDPMLETTRLERDEAVEKLEQLTVESACDKDMLDKYSAEVVSLKEEVERLTLVTSDLKKCITENEDRVIQKDRRIVSLEAAIESQIDKMESLEAKLELAEEEIFTIEDEISTFENAGPILARLDEARAKRLNEFRSSKVDSAIIDRMDLKVMRRSQASSRSVSSDVADEKFMAGLDNMEDELKNMGDVLRQPGFSISDLNLSNHNGKTQQQVIAGLAHREQMILAKEEELRSKEAELQLKIKEVDTRDHTALNPKQSAVEKALMLAEMKGVLARSDRMFDLDADSIVPERVSAGMLSPSRDEVEALEKELLELKERNVVLEEEISESTLAMEAMAAQKAHLLIELEEMKALVPDTSNDLKMENELLKEEVQTIRAHGQEVLAKHDDQMQLAEQEHLKTQEEMQNEIDALKKSISEQLAELDRENQELSDALLEEQSAFDSKIEERDALIESLRREVDELRKDISMKEDGAYVSALLKDINDLKADNKTVANLREQLESALEEVEAKTSLVKHLQEELLDAKEQHLPSNPEVTSHDELEKVSQELERVKRDRKIEQQEVIAKLKSKDETIGFLQEQLVEAKKNESKSGGGFFGRKSAVVSPAVLPSNESSTNLEHLEEEISHWKSVNIELEDEVEHLKSKVETWRLRAFNLGFDDGDESDMDMDEDASMTSDKSNRSASMRSNRTNGTHGSQPSIIPSNLIFVSGSSDNVVDTPGGSQRGGRTLANLWSKISSPTKPSNPAIPSYDLDG